MHNHLKNMLFLCAPFYILLMIPTTDYAVTLGKPRSVEVPLTGEPNLQTAGTGTPFKRTKSVFLMNLQLSDAEKKFFSQRRSQKNIQKSLQEPSDYDIPIVRPPSRIQLGMNRVPVLDQGRHGTCVTFAVTGALNALIIKGDPISQLCSLELGAHLENNGYIMSGWDGTLGRFVLHQIEQFGMISQKKQRELGCAGTQIYPMDNEFDQGTPMTLEEFKSKSEPVSFTWETFLNFEESFGINTHPEYQGHLLLSRTKNALAAGQRLTMGVMLPSACDVGACATYHATHDTWALTSEVDLQSEEILGGHEMIITGYDDNAIAKDKNGKKHKGLFTLRNSWGTDMGDQGEFYMSYDFFKLYLAELYKISN
jgi:hypothetical protein